VRRPVHVDVSGAGQLEQLLPNWHDASTWNWTAMSPLFRDYNVTIGNASYSVHRQIFAGWYQDDWKGEQTG
jgi:hypothetical protein